MADNDIHTRYREAQEEKARGEGWVPLDDWQGSPEDWVDAPEFNVRGELMKRIKSQTRAIQTLRTDNERLNQTLQDLADHNKKLAQSEKKKLLSDLKKEKRQAERNEDYDLADEIEDKIDEVREMETQEEEKKEEKSDTEESSPNQEEMKQQFMGFLQRNPWYADPNSEDMKLQADKIGYELMTSNPEYQYDPEGYFKEIEKQVRKQMPEKFKKKEAADVTEPSEDGGASGRKQGGKKRFTPRDLSDEQKQIARRFVQSGTFDSEQEYVDQLVEIGELG